MPRSSIRKKVHSSLSVLLEKRKKDAVARIMASNAPHGKNNVDVMSLLSDDTIEDMLDASVAEAEKAVRSKRYFFRRNKYRLSKKAKFNLFERDLSIKWNEDDGTPPWLSVLEFLEKYRIHRESLLALFEKIKDHAVFQTPRCKKKQSPVAYQLMVFLFYIGSSGSGASYPRLRNVFGIGRGTADVFETRVIKAIRSLHDEAIFWPDVKEREMIACRIQNKYNWFSCIAVADGTLFPLTYMSLSLKMRLITMDVILRIRYLRCLRMTTTRKFGITCLGFLDVPHDNRDYNKTSLAQDPVSFFGQHYFLLADSAMTNSPTVVSSFT